MYSKITALSIFLFAFLFGLKAQGLFITFDDTAVYKKSIRFVNNHSSKNWQIGRPNKTKFPYEPMKGNAIITDTSQQLTINDTFIFTVEFIRNRNGIYHAGQFELQFEYKIDGDANDYGKVEISVDHGETWIDLIKQDTTYDFEWEGVKPTLLGGNSGWQTFDLSMTIWANGYIGEYPIELQGKDSILYRFTYITDTVNHPSDGWLIDDLVMINNYLSIYATTMNQLGIKVFPVPATDYVYLKNERDLAISHVSIINTIGVEVLSLTGDNIQMADISQLPDGCYTLVFECDYQTYHHPFIVLRH
jgi:hypothetical protein